MNQNLTHWRLTLTHWRSLLEYNCTTQHISKVLNLSILFDPTIPLLRINLGKIDMAVWNLINKHTHIHSYIVMRILKAKDGNILMIIWWEIHWIIYSHLFHSIQWLKITSQKNFPGCPVADTLWFQCRGPEFYPWSENSIPHATTKRSCRP